MLNKYLYRALRNSKSVHYLNNIINTDTLSRNKELYKKFELNKSIYDSVSSLDFQNPKFSDNWLDNTSTVEELYNHYQIQLIQKVFEKEAIVSWLKDGYIILKDYYRKEYTSIVRNEIIENISLGKLKTNYTGTRITGAHSKIKGVGGLLNDISILSKVNFLLGKKALPFQTLVFTKGSEQKTHADIFHMTTYPIGYLIGVWIALEDVNENNGPLYIYPGSHKLEPILRSDLQKKTELSSFFIDSSIYKRYEEEVEKKVTDKNIRKKIIEANEGDVIFWHANLLHGGMTHMESNRTRFSQVNHYFAEDVICYHDITQRPSIIEKAS